MLFNGGHSEVFPVRWYTSTRGVFVVAFVVEFGWSQEPEVYVGRSDLPECIPEVSGNIPPQCIHRYGGRRENVPAELVEGRCHY